MDIETKPGKDSVQHRDRGRKEKRSENKKKNGWKKLKHASETYCITCASKVKLQFLNTVKRSIKIAILCHVLAAFYKHMLQNFAELHMLKNKL